jgi:nicotinamide-nucleotide amidase
MRGELISVGTELLLGQITDTNATFLSQVLADHGVDVLFRQTVGDNLDRVVEVTRHAIQRSDLIVMTGGLGPTEDDLTVEAVALAAGMPLVFDKTVADRIRAMYEQRRRAMPESVFRQARIPEGAEVIPNNRGTAPGLIVRTGSRTIFMFPGVPREMEGLVADGLVPWLREHGGAAKIRSRVLRIVGLGESIVEDKVKDLIRGTNPTVAPLAKSGEVHLRITAKGLPTDADAAIQSMEAHIRERLGDAVFGIDDETLEAVTARSLVDRGLTLAVAESCTGGLIAARLTQVAGSSAFLLAGFVPYSNEAKVRDLGVSADLIAEHGAVSAPVAQAMARGARERTGADLAIAVTGIAGPTGGTDSKPVGLVHFGIASQKSTQSLEQRFGSSPGREGVRHLTAQGALNLIRLVAQQEGSKQ